MHTSCNPFHRCLSKTLKKKGCLQQFQNGCVRIIKVLRPLIQKFPFMSMNYFIFSISRIYKESCNAANILVLQSIG